MPPRAQRSPGQQLGVELLRQARGVGGVPRRQVSGGLLGDQGGHGGCGLLAIGGPPAGVEPVRGQGLGAQVGGRLALQPAQHRVDQALERPRRAAARGELDGGGDGGVGGDVHRLQLGRADAQQVHHLVGRDAVELGLQGAVYRAAAAQGGHGQGPGEAAVAAVQPVEARRGQGFIHAAPAAGGGLQQLQRRPARGEALGLGSWGSVVRQASAPALAFAGRGARRAP